MAWIRIPDTLTTSAVRGSRVSVTQELFDLREVTAL